MVFWPIIGIVLPYLNNFSSICCASYMRQRGRKWTQHNKKIIFHKIKSKTKREDSFDKVDFHSHCYFFRRNTSRLETNNWKRLSEQSFI